jgi:hypothetical protein
VDAVSFYEPLGFLSLRVCIVMCNNIFTTLRLGLLESMGDVLFYVSEAGSGRQRANLRADTQSILPTRP